MVEFEAIPVEDDPMKGVLDDPTADTVDDSPSEAVEEGSTAEAVELAMAPAEVVLTKMVLYAVIGKWVMLETAVVADSATGSMEELDASP